MSSDSDSDSSYTTDDSEYDFISGYEVDNHYDYEVEDGVQSEQQHAADRESTSQLDQVAVPYADEPIASAEWLAEYERERHQEEERRQELQNRIDGLDAVGNWCSCGNCNVELLQNVYECRCCREIDQCVEALNSEFVLEVVEVPPSCVTLHPGFRSVCLDKWSLRSSAGKYKTKENKRYRQSGSEESFFRSVSYREFSQLIYGLLGRVRNPLPACAYNVIRREFRIEEEGFTGFEFDDDL